MSCNISIFAKRAFTNVNPGQEFEYKGAPPKRGYLMRVSSMIRGDQIADYIGAKLNPTSGYENDVCIYVKPHIKKGDMDFKFEGKPYLDIVDGHNLGQLMLKYPQVKVIVCSLADEKTMRSVIPNEITYIPQHHCNYGRVTRNRSGISTVGMIGTRDAFGFLPPELKPELAKRGIELLEYSQFFTRQDIIDFYTKIDVQVVWRPYKKLLSNPLKLVNASSFGIPTIALDEPAFKEMGDCYLPVHNLKGFLDALDTLRMSPEAYADYAGRCLVKSEDYHIDRVGKMYLELCTT